MSYEFDENLKSCGIVPQLTPPGTPQRNGVSERRNRTLLDMVRSMMSFTDLPLSFWGYALETAAFTLNRAPSKSVETTPYEIWFGKKPNLSFLKIWGCEAYVKCWRYAQEAIIIWLLSYLFVHDNVYYSCYNCIIRRQ